MKPSVALAAFCVVAFSGISQAVELPKEVTPAIRATCEKDVRRLCIRKNSTFQTVIVCVKQKFRKLNTKCQLRLVRAGL